MKTYFRVLGSVVVLAGLAAGQTFRGVRPASVLPVAPVAVEAGAVVEIVVPVQIRPGYHMNSDKPNEQYLIPTSLEWTADGFEVESVEYPEAEEVVYAFSDKPLSVFSGKILIRSRIRAPKTLPPSLEEVTGKLRYQACTDKACLAPRTVDVKVAIRPS